MADRSRSRAALRWLSGRPDRLWPDAVLHHGVRLLLAVGLAFAVSLFFPIAPTPDFPVLEKGMVAEEDIIAEVAFPVYKTDAKLAAQRAEAAAGVAPVFQYRPAAADTMLARIDAFLARLDSVASGPADAPGAAAESAAADSAAVASRIRGLLRSYGFVVSGASVALLRSEAARERLARSLEEAIRGQLPAGVVATGALEESSAAQVRLRWNGRERLVARESVETAADFYRSASMYLPEDAPADLEELQRLILIRFFEPSLTFDRQATEAARARARQAVPTVKAEVLAGERIIAAHEQVGEEDLRRLAAYKAELAERGALDSGGDIGRELGAFAYNLLIVLLLGFAIYFYRSGVYHGFRNMVVVGFLSLALVATAAAIARGGLPVELIPIAFPTLVIAVLWGGRLALTAALLLAVLLAGQSAFLGISALFTLVLGGAATAMAVRVVLRRAQTWIFASIIAAAYGAGALTLGLLRSWEPVAVLWSVGYGAANAIASAIVAMGFLPLFEAFTGETTDQTLLELSDLNRPLLQRLQREARGTFTHTLSVANIAEAAARAIGANALLTRVGIYYHDVGKLAKPQHFIENQPHGRNPHDRLKPSMSAAVVRGHIEEGLRLADEHGLPDCVKAFIPEHHGTQSIGFFYDQACAADPEGEPDERDFVYPGPRPQSKETAIAMLADSVESATRALDEPTPERIEELVDRITGGKIEQGQLDEAPLTLGELTQIKEQFAHVLAGMYHQRIDYPPEPPEPDKVGAAASRPGRAAPAGG